MSFLRHLFRRKQTTAESSQSRRDSEETFTVTYPERDRLKAIEERVASIIRGIGTRTAWEQGGTNLLRDAEKNLVNLGSDAVEPLITVLKHQNVGLTLQGVYESRRREVAASALGNLKNPRAVAPLIRALRDEYWPVVNEAAKALGEIGDPQAVEPLITALKHKETAVRASAAEALGKINEAKAVEALIPALADEEGLGGVQDNAAIALGNIGDRRAVEPLIIALKSRSESLRKHAAEALGRIGHPSAAEALEAARQDEGYWVREKAREALERIRSVAEGFRGTEGTEDASPRSEIE